MGVSVPLPVFHQESHPERPVDWQQPVTEGEPVPVMDSPRKVDLAITARCNLRCRTCFYADEMVALADMPTSRWLELIDELGDLKVMSVLLTGGEPISHPDLFTIIEAIVRNRMRYQMNSNGTLFNREKAAAIKASSRCDTVQISVDGSRPEIHDSIRGKGSFAKMVRGIEALKDAGVPVSVRVTINRINFRDLPNIFRLLIEDFNIRNVSTNEAFPRGAAQCNITHLDMTPEERRECEKLSLELAETYPTVGAMAGPLVIGRKLKEIDVDLKRPPELRKKDRGYLSACGIANSGLAVMHDGKVVPCHQLPHMVLGQVGVTPIKEIWHESVGLDYLRTRHRVPLDVLEECRGCKYQPYCTGGCPGTAYAVTGRTTARDPRSCYRALKGEDPDFAY